jgi:hypothetical protein
MFPDKAEGVLVVHFPLVGIEIPGPAGYGLKQSFSILRNLAISISVTLVAEP